jgi:hypothetical protein
VFGVVDERDDVNEKYFSTVICEYIKSLVVFKIEIEHFLFEMLIGILVKNKWFAQLQMLLQYHVIDDSVPVAFQLLSISKDDYAGAEQLALDMLQRLKKVDAIVDILLEKGFVLAALRFIQPRISKKSASNYAKRFLDVSIQDSLVYFTVFRFFEAMDYKAGPEYIQKFSKEFAIGRGGGQAGRTPS